MRKSRRRHIQERTVVRLNEKLLMFGVEIECHSHDWWLQKVGDTSLDFGLDNEGSRRTVFHSPEAAYEAYKRRLKMEQDARQNK